MANGDIKITELPVGILVQGSLFITSEPEQGGGYASTKISATDIATLVASIVSYASLNTTSKTVIGAINEIISKAEGKFIVVQTLPVSDIDPFAIYLVPKQTPGQSDFYDEYIYTNNAWEKIGTTDIDLSNYYTKTQIDSLLSAKADTSSLATVATSGNYNDLTNKPTIPQIADNVIGNDSTYSSQKIISLMPTGEASGAIASFKTQIAAPLVDVNLQINAQQAAGTPTPINPLPITGFTGANIPHTGANVWDEVSELGTISTSTGQKAPDTQVSRSKNNINVKPSTRYCIPKQAGTQGFILFYDENDNPIQYVQQTGDMPAYNLSANIPYNATYATFTTPSNCKYILIRYDSTSMANLSVNYPSTDTEYHAYNQKSEIITVDWEDDAGTVYGGELDLLSGVLTVTHEIVDLSTLTWSKNATYWYNTSLISEMKNNGYLNLSAIIAEKYQTDTPRNVTYGTTANTIANYDSSLGGLMVYNADLDTAPTGLIVYELINPVEIQLAPQQITAFVGVNNIWHDANGDTAVKFKQDIENYIADQLASQLANSSRSLNLSKSAPAETEIEIKEEIKEKESEENKR